MVGHDFEMSLLSLIRIVRVHHKELVGIWGLDSTARS